MANRPSLALLAVLLAAGALAASWTHASTATADRHSFHGFSQMDTSHGTLFVVSVAAPPGHVVELEADSHRRHEVGLETLIVPTGQWQQAWNGTGATILARAGPEPPAAPMREPLVTRHGNQSDLAFSFSGDDNIARASRLAATVPHGPEPNGVDILWLNRTATLGPEGPLEPRMTAVVTRTHEPAWSTAVGFAAVGLGLASVAATVAWSRRGRPAPTPSAVALWEAALGYATTLRNTMLLATLVVAAASLAALGPLLGAIADTDGARAAGRVLLAYALACLALAALTATMAWRAHRECQRWRQAQPPL